MRPFEMRYKTHEIAPLGSRSDSQDALPARFIKSRDHVDHELTRSTRFDRASSDPAILIHPRVLRFKIQCGT